MKKIQLVKFFDDKHWADEFCKGNISLNYLGAFWGPDLDKLQEEKEQDKSNSAELKQIEPLKYGQGDFYEGAVLVKEKDCPELPGQFGKYTIGNVIFRVESYRYCNLLCMCIVDYDDERKKINLPDVAYFKEHFGEYAVVVSDTEEFLKRVNASLSQTGYDYVYGRVNYTDVIGDYSITQRHSVQMQGDIMETGLPEMTKSGRMLDVFEKDLLLCKQKEWRLCVNRGIMEEERYEPNPKIASLTDIAEVVPADKVNAVLLSQHEGYEFSLVQPYKQELYQGNISREALQRKICEDGRYRILFNVG